MDMDIDMGYKYNSYMIIHHILKKIRYEYGDTTNLLINIIIHIQMHAHKIYTYTTKTIQGKGILICENTSPVRIFNPSTSS